MIAGSAAAAGVVGGLVLGGRLLRPGTKLLGVPLTRRSANLRPVAKELRRAGKQFGRMADEVGKVRAQTLDGGRQSPIEALLTGLATRRAPRHSS